MGFLKIQMCATTSSFGVSLLLSLLLGAVFLLHNTEAFHPMFSSKNIHHHHHHDARTTTIGNRSIHQRLPSKNNNLIRLLLSSTESDGESANNDDGDGRIDVSLDERLYRIRIPRATGIEWGTDLSFAFVYVRDLDPSGAAAMTGKIKKGDQLCELIPVTTSSDNAKPVNLLGASFDTVMTSFAMLDRTIQEVDLVFFKGTKEELKAVCTGQDVSADSNDITVTVIQDKGSSNERVVQLQAKAGVNVRKLLIDNGINVYQSVTRWTNCKGKQLCGTCIVNVTEGAPNTNWKSMDESSTLRSNPDSYRLSCITFAHGDITVETFPPVNKDQWTR